MRVWLAIYRKEDNGTATLVIVANTWKQAEKLARVDDGDDWELQSIVAYPCDGVLLHPKTTVVKP